jgi:hypothetical protein
VYRSVIGRGNDVFTSVTCSNRERLKGSSVQQLSNARNHSEESRRGGSAHQLATPGKFYGSQPLPLNLEASRVTMKCVF